MGEEQQYDRHSQYRAPAPSTGSAASATMAPSSRIIGSRYRACP
jgi:hypothetical protein